MTILAQTTTPLSVADRLRELHDELLAEREAVLAILTQISTRRAAEYEFDSALRALLGAEAEVERHRPPTVARLAVFLPANVILYSYVLYALVPMFYADEVVIRPATQVKDTVDRLHTLLSDRHGLPVTLVDATQRQFVEDVVPTADAVVFAGTYQNAETVRASLRPDQLYFFLGSGINPIVVTETADLGRAVRDVVQIRLLNSGQDCLGPDAIWVHESVSDDFLAELVAALEAARYGPYDDPASDYGPIFYSGILRQTAEFFCRHQDRILAGGQIDFVRRRIDPTVIVWDRARSMETIEFFGPVFNVCTYANEAALTETLTSPYYAERAMGASVYGDAPRLVEKLARRHSLSLDANLLSLDDGNAPLGGRGPMANYIAIGRRLFPEPILLSKGLADHFPRTQIRAVP